MQNFPPPYCDAQSVNATLRAYGYAVLSPATVAQWAQWIGGIQGDGMGAGKRVGH